MKLSEWLTKEQVSQSDFAKRIGVAQYTVNRYVNGERYPRPRAMWKISLETKGEVRPNDFYTAKDIY